MEWSLPPITSDPSPDDIYYSSSPSQPSLESSVPLPAMAVWGTHHDDTRTAAAVTGGNMAASASGGDLEEAAAFSSQGTLNPESGEESKLQNPASGALGDLGAAGRGLQEEDLPDFAGARLIVTLLSMYPIEIMLKILRILLASKAAQLPQGSHQFAFKLFVTPWDFNVLNL